MDFARCHFADARRARLGQDPHAVPVTVVAGILAHSGAFDGAWDAWDESPPWPCYRSIWEIYGLRRRPRDSRGKRR